MKIIRKAFKYRLDTNTEQAKNLAEFSGACRFVWNKALSMNLHRLENKQNILWESELCFWLKLWKDSDDYGWLKKCHSQPLQQSLKNLDRAFKDGFDKNQPLKRIPNFKKKGVSTDSIRYPQGFKIDQENSKIFIPKIGLIGYRNSRNIEGEPKNITISRKGKYWFVSVQVEIEAIEKPHPSKSFVGIDMGVKRFATLSTRKFYAPLNSFKNKQTKLAKLQRKLKNKVKFSNNWKNLQAEIGELHISIANARHDYTHKVSSQISKSHAVIAIENLNLKNMTKTAKGNTEKYGKNVKQKSGLNRSILDQGIGMFFNQLEYKQNWLGGMVIKIDPKHTSQTCPCCKHKHKDNRKTQSEFVCVECGYSENADYVASINIRTRGHMELANG